uniref:Uncharacterized protein n=1 Tax=Aegilops tauschii TaxID=37682 RepID=M8D667_AEGTA
MVQILVDGSERTGARNATEQDQIPQRVAAYSWTSPADGSGGPDPVPSREIAASGGPDPALRRLVAGGLAAPTDLPCFKLRPCADKFSKHQNFTFVIYELAKMRSHNRKHQDYRWIEEAFIKVFPF